MQLCCTNTTMQMLSLYEAPNRLLSAVPAQISPRRYEDEGKAKAKQAQRRDIAPSLTESQLV